MPNQPSRTISAVTKELLMLLNNARAIIINNPVLDRLEAGTATETAWRTFAVQRYLAAAPFEDLLKSGIAKAADQNANDLRQVLENNLNDELGRLPTGEIDSELAHSTWRKDFYETLGVSATDLATSAPTAGTTGYLAVMDELLASNVLKIAGALLTLEFTIPGEFQRIQNGRNKTFPERFLENKDDTSETAAHKARARLYIDDHISHDAKAHFPDLLDSIEKLITAPENFSLVKEGITAITKAKQTFYQGLTGLAN